MYIRLTIPWIYWRKILQRAERRKFGQSFSQSVDQNGRQQSENRLPLGYPYSFGAAYRSNSYVDFIHKFCRENMFKLTSSFSSWPSEAYQVCMIKFVALRLFLLNCKVNPKVWVKSIQKNEDLILRLISKTLSIRFQNSIDLFGQSINCGKKSSFPPFTLPQLSNSKGKKNEMNIGVWHQKRKGNLWVRTKICPLK